MAEHIYGLFENDTNKRLIERLKKRQANLRLFPDVTAIAPALEPAAAPHFDLSASDWIVFPDLYSVDFFLATITEKFALDELTVCALGDSISDRLRFSQVHADIIPPDRQTSTILSSLTAYSSLPGLRLLIPVCLGEIPAVAKVLRENGAGVQLLPVYEIAYIQNAPRFTTLFRSGAVDEFIFTSPQDVFSFAYFIEPALAQLEAAATDEITFNTLREFGIQPRMYQ
ncbi:MAG TPA: uroporphyrinogen-III synthase [Pyrinomonadaceae bacterium]|jgi:uroporphyrinogen-III synthase|nr:uroporphyrinogen-III synthase [Pyrinomonadaceae bacterium]